MDLRIFTRNIELNSEAEQYIDKKLDRLNRHLRGSVDAKLELSRTTTRSEGEKVMAQMTISAAGSTLRGQEAGLNLFAAMDAVTDVMDRQIRRYKTRVSKSNKRDSVRTPDPVSEGTIDLQNEIPEDAVVAEFGQVVRSKRFPMKPMAIEDAIVEMELLDHDFFLFQNIETEGFNVIYKRTDGDYGLIEPEAS
ncbi:MAG: ribosomal subunit interface protein [SAR202 cluster bacterium Casp-Chloro-G4]|nr:ribosome-associated translation inhibitor RaiA [Chloroflexota bacterium]MDA1227888.1 ribosome-associated translation inhibitor RaiA [Chloroflexota bacterium]PKB61431.1 MAG: ribosomal subunit interface protein [SAR202 cluster bacterium Casp-Chloro-G4]